MNDEKFLKRKLRYGKNIEDIAVESVNECRKIPRQIIIVGGKAPDVLHLFDSIQRIDSSIPIKFDKERISYGSESINDSYFIEMNLFY